MAPRIRLFALALLCVASLASASASAADNRNEPSENPSYYAYNVGFRSEVIEGEGRKVTRVRRGSMAEEIGLKPGDVVMAVNDVPVDYLGAWEEALNVAYSDGGWVTMAIRDGETGETYSRHFALYDGAFL